MTIRSSPLWQLILARWRHFFREPSTIFWAFGFPLIIALTLGIAFRTRPPEPIYVGVLVPRATQGKSLEAGPADPAGHTLAQKLASDLARAGGIGQGPARIELRVSRHGAADGKRALATGRIAVLVHPTQPLTYEFDPTRPESRLARAALDQIIQTAAGRRNPVVIKDALIVAKGSRYIDFLLPGLLGLVFMQSGIWGVGYVIVEMRMGKLIKRLMATPMSKTDFLFAFVLMRAFFLLIELPLLLGFGWLVFGVEIQGSIALVSLLCILGSLVFAGMGLLVASRAANTTSVAGLINVVTMPMFLGSGVFFSIERFPEAIQPVLKLLPLTALLDGLRGVINDGEGLLFLIRPIAILVVWGLLCCGAALKLFRWR